VANNASMFIAIDARPLVPSKKREKTLRNKIINLKFVRKK